MKENAQKLLDLRLDPHNIVHEVLGEQEGARVPESHSKFIELLTEAAEGKIDLTQPQRSPAHPDYSASDYKHLKDILAEKLATGQTASMSDKQFFADNGAGLLEQLAAAVESDAINERAKFVQLETAGQDVSPEAVAHLKNGFDQLMKATVIRESAIPMAIGLGASPLGQSRKR